MKTMIIAVHPDDETLGCGGTLLRHKKCNDSTTWAIVTRSKDEVFHKNRQEEIKKIRDFYQFDTTEELNFNTSELDQVPEAKLINAFSELINKHQPEILYLPFCHDVHSDHRIVFNAIFSCTKNFRYPFIKKILMMETISETDFTPAIQSQIFNPNVFIDVSDFFEKKLEAFQIYKSEVMANNLPRSLQAINALGAYRGSQIGKRYAEAFQLLKEIY